MCIVRQVNIASSRREKVYERRRREKRKREGQVGSRSTGGKDGQRGKREENTWKRKREKEKKSIYCILAWGEFLSRLCNVMLV